MSLTYQAQDSSERLEDIEWDRIWVQNTWDTQISRFIMIGDSITEGIRESLNKHPDCLWLADSYATSKGLDNPYLISTVRLFMAQEPPHNAIVFNNGLHGWHLNDEKEYAEHFKNTVAFLRETYPDTPLLLSLCTYLKAEERNNRVNVRNSVIRAVAGEYKLPVIDLYTVSKNNADLLAGDGVHFTNYRPLCDEILRQIAPFM